MFGGYIKSIASRVLAAEIEGRLAPNTVSGWLALEFVNTIENYRLDQRLDEIPDYDGWIGWCKRENLILEVEAKDLTNLSRQFSDLALRAMQDARVLRQSMYDLFSAIAHDLEPPAESLVVLNQFLEAALARSRVLHKPDGFAWGWETDDKRLDRLIWPVTRSAADLLTSPELSRLRQCGGHACSWLFLDLSKNHSRRWCDMSVCGNRAKSKRHYERRRADTT